MPKVSRDKFLANDAVTIEQCERFIARFLRRYISDVELVADATQSALVRLIAKLNEEVVRLNAHQDWMWQPFDAFVANNPGHAQALRGEAGFDTYVLVSPQGVATPMNSALKRILNGQIDSLHYVATFLSEPVDLSKALSGQDFAPLTEDPALPSN